MSPAPPLAPLDAGYRAMSASDACHGLLRLTDIAVIAYFLAINSSYLLLILLAGLDIVRNRRRAGFTGADEAYASPFTLPVSVLVPAYNEEAGIVEAVRALLGLRYPIFEIIVIDDGSKDGTFAALHDAFDLKQVPYAVPQDVPVRGAVLSVHLPTRAAGSLLVARKENGGKTDSLNVGLNLARYPLVCMVDADSILDSSALLTVAKPFSDEPDRVVATGGVVRVANECGVLAGRVVEARWPRAWLPRIQTVEYLRAFLLGRAGWSRISGLVIISGAFGLFRRDLVVELGGLDPETIGEDAELVVRVHRRLRDQRADYRIRFVPEPVSWSEAPSTFSVLARQRRRWHRGLSEILLKHRRMIGNPRYGRIGLLVLPYYILFELLAPVVELSGLVLIPIGLSIGAINARFALEFAMAAYGFAFLVSLTAIAADEYAHHRYPRWRDLGSAVLGAITENLGYRQAVAWWCLQGMWAGLRKSQHEWGTMTRAGFATATAADGSPGSVAPRPTAPAAALPAVEAPTSSIPQRAPRSRAQRMNAAGAKHTAKVHHDG